MSNRDDHYELGRRHAYDGDDRYKFQDPALQARYDKGYDEISEKVIGERLARELQDQYIPGFPGRIKRF